MIATPLDASAIYVSPAGHRCRWEPLGGKYRDHTNAAYFVYVDRPKRCGDDDGFTLKASLYHLLKKEAAHAPTR